MHLNYLYIGADNLVDRPLVKAVNAPCCLNLLASNCFERKPAIKETIPTPNEINKNCKRTLKTSREASRSGKRNAILNLNIQAIKSGCVNK